MGETESHIIYLGLSSDVGWAVCLGRGPVGHPWGEGKPAPAPANYRNPKPETRGADSRPAPAPVRSETHGSRVQTRPIAIFREGCIYGNSIHLPEGGNDIVVLIF